METTGMVDSLFETSEHVIKNSFIIHDVGTSLIRKMTIIKKEAYSNETVFLMHIPRTALDTIRMTLLGDTADILDQSRWSKRNAPFQYKNIKELNTSKYKVIKGFFSWSQMQEVESKKSKKVIIFLRHPIERVISLHKLLKPRSKFLFGMSNPSLINFLKSDDERIVSFLDNGMMWQISSDLYKKERKFNNSELAYSMAKKNLAKADFIGFFEDLLHDYYGLYDAVFYPNIEGGILFRLFFMVGAWIGLPRLRVLKYSKQITKAEKDMIIERNKYDLALYQYAKELQHKEFHLYDGYIDFFWYEWHYTLFWLILSTLLWKTVRLISRRVGGNCCGIFSRKGRVKQL